ncbi:uncharacterized protein A4U43_C10F6910 [Asparagus officinalis]|uniref:Uncharacterized protein n=1 Tax=Asparagus officinalis TaxID=4686 RepID=A0A5P1E178_ASPOF|nr:uncharacterized protein A4U43_C10F6910 [Asparagus officinalis]
MKRGVGSGVARLVKSVGLRCVRIEEGSRRIEGSGASEKSASMDNRTSHAHENFKLLKKLRGTQDDFVHLPINLIYEDIALMHPAPLHPEDPYLVDRNSNQEEHVVEIFVKGGFNSLNILPISPVYPEDTYVISIDFQNEETLSLICDVHGLRTNALVPELLSRNTFVP